jgi:putative ABC transport system substrate-binding protein
VITRRGLIVAFATGALLPTSVCAQQAGVFRVGWLSSERGSEGASNFAAFREGLRDLGYVEGRNLVIDARWGEGSSERLEQLAVELVRSNPQVIVTQGGPGLQPVRRAGATMPVVFGYSGDPVEAGYVDSYAHPGRNFTGVTFLSLELVGKRMELLKETMPVLKRVAIVANPEHPGQQGELRASHAAAKKLGIAIEFFEVRNAREVENALATIQKTRSEAIVVFPDSSMARYYARFAAFAIQNRIPAVSGRASFADSGNLLSYGPSLRNAYRRLAIYVDKILKGARPADIPVELPTSVELVVNLKAAEALGVTIPRSILLRADRVIE